MQSTSAPGPDRGRRPVRAVQPVLALIGGPLDQFTMLRLVASPLPGRALAVVHEAKEPVRGRHCGDATRAHHASQVTWRASSERVTLRLMTLNDPFATHPVVPSFTVTSTTLNEGDTLGLDQMSGIFGVPGGKDRSPQLSWSGPRRDAGLRRHHLRPRRAHRLGVLALGRRHPSGRRDRAARGCR